MSARAQDSRPRRPVPVVISGKEYRVVTDRDDEWIARVAELVDKAMTRVRDETETVDTLDVAVLTALHLAQNLMILRDEGILSPGVDRGRNRADAQRLREIVHIAEEALRVEPPV